MNQGHRTLNQEKIENNTRKIQNLKGHKEVMSPLDRIYFT